MNYSNIQTNPIHKNVHCTFFLAIILFTFFSTIAEAKLTIEECNKKELDLNISAIPATGEASNFNINQFIIKLNVASYKRWLGIEALFRGECSHTAGAIESVSEAKKYLQEAIEKCQANGQGPNCGVGPVTTNSQQNNSQIKPSQPPIAADGLDDDPKVFGGSSSGKR